jgi:two-component system sensor histidine kinase KdpD
VLDRLAALAAESLAAPRALDAVRAIARGMLSELGVQECRVVVLEPEGIESVTEPDRPGAAVADPELLVFAAGERRLVGVRRDGTAHLGPPDATISSMVGAQGDLSALLIPLQVFGSAVGVLVLADPDGLRVPREQVRFADTLVYYAALAVERVRLTAASEHVETLREADRLKDALLASVSHDLRTPLTTIRALASELRATGDERAIVIEEEADRLNRMVADLLDLSRIRGGPIRLEPQLIAAEDLVGAVLQRLGGLPGIERVVVRLPPGGALPVGRFDFVQALRSLANLTENALRHSPDGAPIELEVAQEGPELRFTVLDRGPSVPEAEREHIFEPFVRGSGARAGGGTGLGLPIARSLAEAQDGSVHYRARPDGGNAFELRLPAGFPQDH